MTVSEHRFEVALPRGAWAAARRPIRGIVFRWLLALTFVSLGLGMPSLPLRLVFIALGIVAYVVVGRIVDTRLEAVAQEIARVPRNEASRWLAGLERRRVVALFAPHAWVALQKGRLHLRIGDGRAAAKAFEESARMLGDAEHPALLGARAEALIEAGDLKDAQAILLGLDKRGVLTATDRVNLGLTLASDTGRAKRAVDLLEQARQELGESPRLIAALALAYAKHDRLEVARELVEALDRAALVDGIALDLVKRTRKQLRPLLEETRRARRGGRGKKGKRPSGSHKVPAEPTPSELAAEPGAPKRPASSFESSELRSEVSGTFEFDPGVHGVEPPVPKYRDPAEDVVCPRTEDVTAPEVIPPISGELTVPRGGTRLPDRRPTASDSEGAPIDALPDDEPEFARLSESDAPQAASEPAASVSATAHREAPEPIEAASEIEPTIAGTVREAALASDDAMSGPEPAARRGSVHDDAAEAALGGEPSSDDAMSGREAAVAHRGSVRDQATVHGGEAALGGAPSSDTAMVHGRGAALGDGEPTSDTATSDREAAIVRRDSLRDEALGPEREAALGGDEPTSEAAAGREAPTDGATQERTASPSDDGEPEVSTAEPTAMSGERPAALEAARQRAEAALRRARAREQESEERRARALAARERVPEPPHTGTAPAPAPVVVADKPNAPQRSEVDDGWAELFTYDDDVAPAPSSK